MGDDDLRGNPTEEIDGLPTLPALGTHFLRSVWAVPEFGRPKNLQRRLFAAKLADIALDFIVAHEFAHIANGHLDRTRSIHGISVMSELDTSSPSLESQVVEMDADATAVHLSLGHEWGTIVGIPHRQPVSWADYYWHPGQVNLLWSWAIGSFCRIFGDSRTSLIDQYPSWRLRSVMIQQETANVALRKPLKHPAFTTRDSDGIPITITAAHRQVEEVFERITGLPPATEALEESWSEAGRSHIGKLRNYWTETLRAELAPFAYQPLQ